jgi:hypothetical protein
MAAVTEEPSQPLPVAKVLSGPVPRGLRLAFVVLTVVAAAFAVFAAVRGVWLVTVVCGLFALLNLGVLWATRASAAR